MQMIDKVREYPYDIVRLHMLQSYEKYVLKHQEKMMNEMWINVWGYCNNFDEEVKPDFVVDASK